ncbi:MAG: CHASE2 domain-containing serine/threonine-protein kinase [Calditrichia bacterium]
MNRPARILLTGLLLSALAILFGLYSLANNTTRRYDDRALDYFIALRTITGEKSVDEAAIVLVDEAAIAPYGYYDPIPRRYLANLIDSLNGYKAAVIALDISLLNRFVPDPAGDSLLATSLRRADNVVGICLEETREDTTVIQKPAKLFADELYDMGHAMLQVGGGVFGRVKGIKPWIIDSGDSIPAIGLILAQHFSGKGKGSVRPPDMHNELRLNYVGPPGKWERTSAGIWIQAEEGAIPTYRSSLLTGKTPLPKELFRERVVLIGGGVESAKDRFYTPYATAVFDERLMRGVEVHANSFLMFLHTNYLEDISKLWSYALYLLIALLIVFGTLLLRPSRGLLLTVLLLLLIWISCYIYFAITSSWVPVTGLTTTLLSGFILAAISRLYWRHVADRQAKVISHYRLEKLLGEGGMGKVFLATDKNSDKEVAIKILHNELLEDEENRRRLNSEGFILSSFNHPNIVRAFEVGESAGRKFIAMEYLSGGTLADFLKENHPLSLSQIRQIVLQVCSALKEIHRRNIIHRDLKTANIMLDGSGSIRVMDFGLSKSSLIRTQTSSGGIIGTLGYTAPEQITNREIDCRSDIFSFGVILYELLTNQSPFRGDNEISIMHSIFNDSPTSASLLRNDDAGSFDAIIERCLAKNPDDRYQTIAEVEEAL